MPTRIVATVAVAVALLAGAAPAASQPADGDDPRTILADSGPAMADATTLDQLTSAGDFYAEYADVLRLYQAFFRRQPDLSGARYWIRIYRQQYEIDEIANSFEASAEFSNTYGRLGDRAFVETVYGNVLGRDADPSGLEYWLGELTGGRLDRGGVVRWIAANAEFVDANRFAGEANAKPGADRAPPFRGIDEFAGTWDFRRYSSSDRAAWDAYTDARYVTIPSSADGSNQAAFWAPADGADRPLLVVLHSWSSGFDQQQSIPFARWADRNDWAMIAPNFRGPNNNPSATGSDLTISDIRDAVAFALANDDIRADKVFMIGFSGGGMAVLNMAGEAPELFAGGAAWVGVYDLVDWYAYRLTRPRRHYVGHIEASCGGPPTPGTAAAASCAARSPSSTIANAKAANIPIYLGVGLQDLLVPTSYSFRAFDALAAPEDRFGPDVWAAVDRNELPAELRGENDGQAWFDAQDPFLYMSRTSGNVTLSVFSGGHGAAYEPGLEWMARTAWALDR